MKRIVIPTTSSLLKEIDAKAKKEMMNRNDWLKWVIIKALRGKR